MLQALHCAKWFMHSFHLRLTRPWKPTLSLFYKEEMEVEEHEMMFPKQSTPLLPKHTAGSTVGSLGSRCRDKPGCKRLTKDQHQWKEGGRKKTKRREKLTVVQPQQNLSQLGGKPWAEVAHQGCTTWGRNVQVFTLLPCSITRWWLLRKA